MSWRALLTYWRGKHVGGKPPSRGDIDPPSDLPSLVRSLFLMNVEGEQFRFRLIGSEIVSWSGRDSTGRQIDESLMRRNDLNVWRAGLLKVAKTQTPVLAVTRRMNPEYARLIGLALPLVAADGSTEMIFGGLFCDPAYKAGKIVDLDQIHGLVECGIPDDLADEPMPIAAGPSARVIPFVQRGKRLR